MNKKGKAQRRAAATANLKGSGRRVRKPTEKPRQQTGEEENASLHPEAPSTALTAPPSEVERLETLQNYREPNRMIALSTVWAFPDMTPLQKAAFKQAAKQHYLELQPTDAIECGLAIAMTASLQMGLGCMGTAQRARDQAGAAAPYMAYGLKAFDTYANLAQRPDKRRGRADQKVVVRHVHVGAGGQAIVGDVTTSAGQLQGPHTAATEITSTPMEGIASPADLRGPQVFESTGSDLPAATTALRRKRVRAEKTGR